MITFCCFQGDHPETFPGLSDLELQGGHQVDGPDLDDDDRGCDFPVGELPLHAPGQNGEHGLRLQTVDGAQVHKQVGAKVPIVWPEPHLNPCIPSVVF